MPFELQHDRRNITDQDLLSDLRRVADEQSGKSVTQSTYRQIGKYSDSTVMHRFGSWNGALEAAALAKTVDKNISNERLFAGLYDLWVCVGRQPSYSEVRMPHCRYHVATYERRFGSWRGALEAFVSFANSSEAVPPAGPRESKTPTRRTSRTIDLRLRFKVLSRDSFRCRSCGASPSTQSGVHLEVDHIVPWSKDGETVLDNLQTLCSACNQGKSNMHEE
ncbi:MAG TPA: HNH endonuclease [Bryobacteraceae bacterium]|nr:HNH endonuclease [Bryobacteraceae bacterium]